ncbi:MAG: hypothetical protein ACQESN_00290 [Thermotogota bacterium]
MNKKIVILINVIVLLFIFLPINVVIEDENNNINIFSTGFNILFYKSNSDSDFVEKRFLFYNKISYSEYLILNYSNFSFRFTFSDNKIQDQFNKEQAYFFIDDQYKLYNTNKLYYSDEWLKHPLTNSVKFIEKYLENFIFEQKYFLFSEYFRSFHVKPNIFFINNKKDFVHEITHSLIDDSTDHERVDIWPEILCEANSLLYLKETNKLKYENEIELKQLNYYMYPYGIEVLSFVKKFNFNSKEIFEFENYILKNYKKLNDEQFFNLIESYKGE